jgi:hypothetical protein
MSSEEAERKAKELARAEQDKLKPVPAELAGALSSTTSTHRDAWPRCRMLTAQPWLHHGCHCQPDLSFSFTRAHFQTKEWFLIRKTIP